MTDITNEFLIKTGEQAQTPTEYLIETPIEQLDEYVQSPTILIPKKNIIIDATMFTSVQSCGRFTDFRFNHNLVSKDGKSVNLEMGSIVHKFLEVYYRAQMQGLSRIQAQGQAYIAATEYANDPTEVRNCTDEDKQLALLTCEQYVEFYKNDHWIPLAVEETKGKIFYEDDEIRILWKAKFDWITDTNQGVYPVDHKTMKQRRDTRGLNNQFKGQCITLGTRGVFINKIGFQKTLEPKEKFTRPLLNYTYDSLLEFQSEIVPYWCKIFLMYQESGHWPPNYTHCENKWGFCEYYEVCEADRIMRNEVLMNEFVVGKSWDPSND